MGKSVIFCSGVLKPTHATHSFERVDLPCLSEALLIPKCNLTEDSEEMVVGGGENIIVVIGSLGASAFDIILKQIL